MKVSPMDEAASYKLQAWQWSRDNVGWIMKDKTLIVKKKNVYGNELIYPVCQDSIIFSYIAGTKTFCSITIANIKKLGYKFETQKEEIWKKLKNKS